MNGKYLKIIKFCKTKKQSNSLNITDKYLNKYLCQIKQKKSKNNYSMDKKSNTNSIILQLIDNINNMEKQLKKENKKLIEKEIYKNKCNSKNNDKIIIPKSKANHIKSKKQVENRTISHEKKDEKSIKIIQKKNKINIIQIPIRKISDKDKEKHKEIINYTNHFYKDSKQASIKSIDIPTNTNSDISSMNNSFFINYKLGGEATDIDEFEFKSINEIIHNNKLNNYKDKKYNKEEEIIIFNDEKSKINSCKTIKLNSIFNKKKFY